MAKKKAVEGTYRVKTKGESLLTSLPPSFNFYKFHFWASFCLSSIIRHFTKLVGVSTWTQSTAKHCDKSYSSGSTPFIQLIISGSLWEYTSSRKKNTLESRFWFILWCNIIGWALFGIRFPAPNVCNYDLLKDIKTWKYALWFMEFPQTDPVIPKPNQQSKKKRKLAHQQPDATVM